MLERLRGRYGLAAGEARRVQQRGKRMGVNRVRIRQIEHQALRKLHRILEQERKDAGQRRAEK